MIKIKDFVDVNLTSVQPSSDEENKTVVYIYGQKGAQSKFDEYLNASNYETKMATLDSKAQAFITQFFNLGGASLRVIRIVTVEATSYNVVNDNNNLFLQEIRKLPMTQVAFVVREAQTGNIATEGTEYDSSGYHFEDITINEGASNQETINCFGVLLASLKAVVAEQGTAFRKLVVRGHYTDTAYTETEIVGDGTPGNTGLERDENLIWKLCKLEKDLASVLAYFSKVTLRDPNTLKDYCFTEELSCDDMRSAFTDVIWSNVKNFINADIDLQQNGTIINLGGNTSKGYDMIQEFESVYISQAIVNVELSLLMSKINLSNAKSLIHASLINVLEKYYNLGYLIQTQYTGANIYRNVGGNNVCILASGEVITGGYKINILPKVPGSDIHEFPEVEIIINTNKGIRFIKTTGVVL